MLRTTLEKLQTVEFFGLSRTENITSNASSPYDGFETLVVLEFSKSVPPTTISWLLDRITMSKLKGGSELLICPIVNENQEILKVHISATLERLLVAAEMMEIKKLYRDGNMRDICIDDMDNYKNSDDPANFLTCAERQRIILHELEAIRAHANDFYIASMPLIRLYQGEPIIPRCLNEGIITDCIALHDKKDIADLSKTWFTAFFSFQPLDSIQDYFGQTIAMYFAFLGHYTYFLLLSAVFGVVSQLILMSASQDIAVVAFFVFNLVWATIFLESWKRRSSELAFHWGTLNTEFYEEPRVEFRGTIGGDPVTGRLQPQYPSTHRLVKFYGVTVPVLIVSLALSFYVMLVYFYMDEAIKAHVRTAPSKYDSLILLLPTIFYAFVLIIMNSIYRPVAIALNNWENHRLQSDYESNLVVKLALFNFANNFLCMFYIAFYMQDLDLLRNTLATLLVTMQIVQQLQEALVPYLMYKLRKVSITLGYVNVNFGSNGGCVNQQTLLRGEVEKAKDTYPGVLDDYLELFNQFGYVFLFSAVYPTAAFWAFVNNLTEIRTDAFKLCRTYRRPFAQPCESIGVWTMAFEILGVIAVVTNCALVAISPAVKQYTTNYDSITVMLVFVAIEHVILAIKATLAHLIPDQPEWVQTQVSAMDYQSKQAWRRQRCRAPPVSAAQSESSVA